MNLKHAGGFEPQRHGGHREGTEVPRFGNREIPAPAPCPLVFSATSVSLWIHYNF